MADEADRASEYAQTKLDAAIAAPRKAHRPEPQGMCLSHRCGEEFTNPEDAQRLFCNAACAQDYERQRTAK